MGVKTQIQIFHGQYNSTLTAEQIPTRINFLSTGNDDVYKALREELVTQGVLLQNESNSNVFPFTLQSIKPPIRFKLQDNDEQDLQFPLQIPQDPGTIYYSYRKQIKLQFIPDQTGKTIIQNLRVYFDTGKFDQSGNQITDTGVIIKCKMSYNYIPQSVLDINNGLGNDQLDQVSFTKLNTFVLNANIVYNTEEHGKMNIKSQIQQQADYTTFFNQLSFKYFGNQPYLYLIVGLTRDQQVGQSSQFNIYYVYDEI